MSTAVAISPTYLKTDIRRVLRNRRAMIFTIAVPAILYLVFGTTQGSGNVGSGNVAFYVMVGMATYGAILAAASNAASVSLEHQNGWTRTLRLTPLTSGGYVLSKVLVALAMAGLSVAVLTVAGLVTGAHASLWVWVACIALAWLGSSVFAALGLTFGSVMRSDGAMQALGGLLALLAFAGNVFVPLKGTMLTISQFTPMFGVANLARYPLTDTTVYGEHISLTVCVVNLVVWGAVFGIAAAFFYSRSTSRQ